MMSDELGSGGAVVVTRRPAALTKRQSRRSWDCRWQRFARGVIAVRDRGSCASDVRYLPSDLDGFVRASAVDTHSDSSSDDDSELGELRV
jgi:hypothetical protein